MKKTTLTALYYTLLTPINVWTGYELGTENYRIAMPLILIVMILEFHCVKYWFEAQTEEIANAGKNPLVSKPYMYCGEN
ncbi:MAG: hypothetical protein OIN83_02360 [Candidatus Methanoperedens sp.]|nr:hypothetical protein [Candidatus Methanoperedens sp.]